MNSQRCVLLFGISGVGKTTAADDFCRRNPAFSHVRASALLSEATAEDPERLRTSDPSQILSNQWMLVEALERYRSARPAQTLVVDAHATIFNGVTVVGIPIEVIAAMRPDALLLLEASPEEVAERRAQAPRSRPLLTLEELHTQLEAERTLVAQYAHDLRLPFEVVAAIPDFRLDSAMDRLLPSWDKDAPQRPAGPT